MKASEDYFDFKVPRHSQIEVGDDQQVPDHPTLVERSSITLSKGPRLSRLTSSARYPMLTTVRSDMQLWCHWAAGRPATTPVILGTLPAQP